MRLHIEHNTERTIISLDQKMKRKMKAIDDTLNVAIEKIASDAKKNLASNGSIDSDSLRNSIKTEKTIKEKIVYVDSDYAPFVEFGTRSRFSLYDPSLARIAARYKSKGGKNPDATKRVTEYLERKGLSGEKLYQARNAIFTKGTRAKPFFYPAVFMNRVSLKKKLRAALRTR